MILTYCDSCKQVIKNGEIKFMLAINEVTQKEETVNIFTTMNAVDKFRTMQKEARKNPTFGV